MADREYSRYQSKVIKAFYDNRDTSDQQRLSELVADLYLTEGKKKAKLWATAQEIMTRMGVPASRIAHVVASDDAAILAEVVKDIQAGKIQKPAPPNHPQRNKNRLSRRVHEVSTQCTNFVGILCGKFPPGY